MTSSHQTLAAALASVVTNSFKLPGQYGARRSQALMIFFALIQLSLSVMGLIPKLEGLSLMEVEPGANARGGGRVTKLDESDDEGNIVGSALDDNTDMPLEGWEVTEERWVRM